MHEQPTLSIGKNKVLEPEEFFNRIKKTLYYGSPTVKCTKISRPLADYAADVFSESHRGHSLNRLNFVTVSNLNVTPCSLILAMIYLDRLNLSDPAYARRITPSELFIVSMMVSTKFYCGYDEDIYLSAWAESGNMSVSTMKRLELEFLDAIDWKVYVSNGEFFEKLKSVEKVLAKRQGIARGWLTYTELINFLPTLTLAKQILNYSAVMALSYTASVMTIAGAFILASNMNVPGNILYRNTDSANTGTLSTTETGPSVESNTIMQPSTESRQIAFMEDCPAMTMSDGDIEQLYRDRCGNFNSSEPTERKSHLYSKLHHPSFNQFPLVATEFDLPSRHWRNFRFIFPVSNGNESDDDDDNAAGAAGKRNCTLVEQLLSTGKLNDDGNPDSDSIYDSYKRTFDMFSSFLKFL